MSIECEKGLDGLEDHAIVGTSLGELPLVTGRPCSVFQEVVAIEVLCMRGDRFLCQINGRWYEGAVYVQ